MSSEEQGITSGWYFHVEWKSLDLSSSLFAVRGCVSGGERLPVHDSDPHEGTLHLVITDVIESHMALP